MSKIIYIPENRVRELIEAEVKANLGKGHIKDPAGFAQHLIDTGNIGHKIALQILENHPYLRGIIDPEAVRLAGWMHDFSKIFEGGEYHEVGTAHLILTQGATNLELLSGKDKSEIKRILKGITSLIPPDYALYEELGGSGYPKDALYSSIDAFVDRVETLRRKLTKTSIPLSIEELALPSTLNQGIYLYADLTNVNGKMVSVKERMDEIVQRYGNPSGHYYNPGVVEVTERIRPRIMSVANTIETLMMNKTT